MANYNKDTDYSALIEQAVKSGNYAGAALLEQQRNNKIADMGLNYEQTNNYGQYLPQNGTSPGGSANSVYTYNDSQGNAKGEMNYNSAQWWAAKGMGDTAMMQSLEAANKQLAALLGGGVQYNPAGYWSGTADMPATKQASMTTGVVAEQPTYQSAYDAQIDALLNQYLGREKFSYDAESDPLYQQYRDIYTREGNRSMNDTLAAAAAGAGGMSSYAMTAAQQANNYYMAQLGDKIPELQQLAYEMYMDDLGLQQQDIGLLMNMENQDYNRYRDQMGDYQWATDFNYGAYRDQVADDRYKTEWEHALEREAYEDEWRNKEWDYGVSRDAVEDAWREKQFNYGVSQDELDNYWRQKQWEYGVSQDQLEEEWRQREWDYNTSLGGLLYPEEQPSDNPNDTPNDNTTNTKTEEEKRYENSKLAMGIGMIRDSLVTDAILAGGIIENDDGSIAWAPGWNKDNWQKKLSLIQSGGNSTLINMW